MEKNKKLKTIEDFAMECLDKSTINSHQDAIKVFNYIAKHYGIGTHNADAFSYDNNRRKRKDIRKVGPGKNDHDD